MNALDEEPAAQAADTVLVVEDEAVIRIVIADYLRDCGYRIFEAGTVAEAIEILGSEPGIDIVFTDIQMPGGRTGFDLCRWVEANMPRVEVVLTSGGVKAAEAAECLCHAGPLVGKPYHLDAVLDRVRSVLGQRGDLAAVD